MKHPASLLVVLALVVLLGACSSSRATGTVPSDGFPAPDKDYVWNVAAQVLSEAGMMPDRESSSKQTWTIVTHWKLSLQPFSGQGYRQRATVTIHDVPGRANYFHTKTQVVRQPNDNMIQPSNPIVADWGDEQRVGDMERLINGRIELRFLSGEVSPEFRQRHGMEARDPLRIDYDQPDPGPQR